MGDVVILGRYAHNHTVESFNDSTKLSEKIPIRWLVLEKEGDRALLLSVLNVDVKKYSYIPEGLTWASSEIREWLNGEFLCEAFDEEERGCLKKSRITTKENPVYHTDGGADTEDYVFLLSPEEAEHYFASDEERRAQIKPNVVPFDDIKRMEVEVEPHWYYLFTDYYGWWLRTPGEQWGVMMTYVDRYGKIHCEGARGEDNYFGIRPAMWVDLNKE